MTTIITIFTKITHNTLITHNFFHPIIMNVEWRTPCLDPKTRKTLDLDLTGAVIIFDEAHNIQKLCEEAASVSVSLADLALAVQDITAIR